MTPPPKKRRVANSLVVRFRALRKAARSRSRLVHNKNVFTMSNSLTPRNFLQRERSSGILSDPSCRRQQAISHCSRGPSDHNRLAPNRREGLPQTFNARSVSVGWSKIDDQNVILIALDPAFQSFSQFDTAPGCESALEDR